MIIDHIGLAVSDYSQSKAFFTQALTPLGITLVMEVEGWGGFGRDGKPEFWFGTHSQTQSPMHIAFAAESRVSSDTHLYALRRHLPLRTHGVKFSGFDQFSLLSSGGLPGSAPGPGAGSCGP